MGHPTGGELSPGTVSQSQPSSQASLTPIEVVARAVESRRSSSMNNADALEEAILPSEAPPDKLNGAVKPLAIIADIVDYDSLHRALRERREALNIPFTECDKAGALAPGHSSKILSPAQIKRATLTTIGYLAPALGAKLVLIENPEALEHLKKHFRTRQVKVSARSVPWGRSGKQTVVSLRFVKRIARAGGEARARALTSAQRSASARKAAKARWTNSHV